MNRARGPLAINEARELLRARGMRWTPQRRAILEELFAGEGHITGVGLVERVRVRNPETTPSTVYRTLDVLEELGFVRHSHGADGREEYHVLPEREHAHLVCESCGRTWDVEVKELATMASALERRHGFHADVPHLTIAGTCADCAQRATTAEHVAATAASAVPG
jgi:Fur family transcriptional regulator, ferric uptake regulator